MTVSGSVIRARDLSVGYGRSAVIKGLSFDLEDGQVLAVVGPNGSGKTTLVKALLGVVAASAGSVELFGKTRLSAPEAEGLVAYIPQRMEIDRTFPITLGEMLSLSAGRDRAERYAGVLDLEGLMDAPVGSLSGGQMQRALLCYAIMKEPRLLVMDEPTSWVDVKGADCILCIMDEFRKRGIAMVIVSHDFSVIRSAATHVLGLGPEGHFFMPATSPDLDDRMSSVFGTLHHGKGLVCALRSSGSTPIHRGHAPRGI